VLLRGIDSPEKLQRWFAHYGHKWLVLRVADILGMAETYQIRLAQILKECGAIEVEIPMENMRPFWQNLGLGGYVRAHMEKITSLGLVTLEDLQEVLSFYCEVRRAKGEPSKTEICECVKDGKAKHACKSCDGEGKIHILLDISDEEEALAKSPA
jgi:hypothetical protein